MARKWQVDTPAQIGGLLEAKSGANITGDISVSGNAWINGNGTMNGDLNLPTDGKGINFFDGAKIFKKVNSGLKIQAHDDTIGVAIVDTAGNDKLVIKTDGSATGLTYNGAVVWTSQNDGAGSGLDADLLDGLHESTFMRKSANSDLTFSISDVTGAVSSSYGIVWSGLTDSFKLFVEEYNTDTTLRTQGQTRLVLHMHDDANEDYFLIRQFYADANTTKDLFHVKYDEIKSFPKLVAAAGLDVTGTLTVTGDITVSGTVDGVDISAFKTAFDSHHHDGAYVNVTGDTMTGNLTVPLLTVNAADGTNGGGQINLNGAGSYPAWSIDVFQNTIRMHSGGITYFQVKNDGTGYINEQKIWTDGNDGSGSGLDADLLDGLQASQFLRSDTSGTLNGNLTLNGNITLNGSLIRGNTTLSLNTAGWSKNNGEANIAGAIVAGTAAGDARFMFHSDAGKMNVYVDGEIYLNEGQYKAWHAGNDGAGSGLDADLLDGIDSTQFVRTDANSTVSGLITVSNTKLVIGDGTLSPNDSVVRDLEHYIELRGTSSTYPIKVGIVAHHENNSTSALVHTNTNDNTSIWDFITDDTAIELRVAGNKVWYAGNDGAGSGLDADLLDGIDSTGFLRRNIDTDTTGKITITRDGDAIVFNKNTTTSYSGLLFTSKENIGSDYAYIRYFDDVSNFYTSYDNGSSSETSALVIGVENDGVGGANDYLVLRGPTKIILDAFASTGSSERVAEFRRQGTIVSYIDNTGKYMGDVDTVDGLHGTQFMRNDTNTSTSGNLSVGGTLNVTGATTLNANLTIAGGNDLSIGATGADDTGDIIFKNSSGNEKVRLYTADTGNVLYISTASSPTSNHFAFDSGKLGIGTTTFESNVKLQLLGGSIVAEESGRLYGMGLLTSATSSGLVFRKDGVKHAGFKWDGSNLYLLDASASGTDPSNWNGTTLVTFDMVNNRVGIGTASPSYKLSVSGSSQALHFNMHSAGVDLYSTGNFAPYFQTDFTIYTGVPGSGIRRFSVQSNGNVGIGNMVPSELLHVAGNIKSDGIIKCSKLTWQVTFAAGETTKTITHNLGTTNYMCALGANSVARHVAWTNKAANTIDIVLDSPYYDGSIVVDVILMAY